MSGDIRPTYPDDQSTDVLGALDRFSVERRGRSVEEYNMRHRLDQINMYRDESDRISEEAPLLPEDPEPEPEPEPERTIPAIPSGAPQKTYPKTQQEAVDRGESMITPILIGLSFLVLANYTTMS